ncbi:unnamed protein product [Rotaria magnacalcarata]|uniref:Uncharacterized protein n=2 Tax=Rotaria magnacalcarata TaxID=392030 RepID=A0A816MVG5_9BILA|nr:unnamed protein product [Rotaria magnacalcarata]CAF1392047.1 unnamed protein product [Rotaria magnacalcarata]CAF2018688.1 unnamed protein product [Rotaria magnacalcarata]CAF2105044.1 unnamed protein product [Rotaria magnacalcarata]CAF3905684.1 unnamed protein product [Rotaria magnacalcarata]
MLSSPSLLESRLNFSSNRSDPDVEVKVRSSVRAINDTVQANANEPSLAFYRIQEHVRKSLPTMIQKRIELENLHDRMTGLIFDIEYSVDAVKSIEKSDEHVNNIATYLEKSIYISKQIHSIKQQQIQQQLLEKKHGS